MAENTTSMAVANGERAVAGDTTKAVMRACAEGNIDEVAALVRRKVGSPALTISQLAVDQAAGAGHAKVLDWLWGESDGAVYPSSSGLEMASAGGKIATLEWAHARGLQGFGPELMDVAAWQGRLSVLKWLRANRNEGCTADSGTWAAKRGHLAVLRWLRNNLGQACTAEGLEAAATAGHVKVVAWFLHNSERGLPTTQAVVGAASNGHSDVLRLLLPPLPSGERDEEQPKSEWAMILANRGGHDECKALLRDAGWPNERVSGCRDVLILEGDAEEYESASEKGFYNTDEGVWLGDERGGEEAHATPGGELGRREYADNTNPEGGGISLRIPASRMPERHPYQQEQTIRRMLSVNVALPDPTSAAAPPPTELLKTFAFRTPTSSGDDGTGCLICRETLSVTGREGSWDGSDASCGNRRCFGSSAFGRRCCPPAHTRGGCQRNAVEALDGGVDEARRKITAIEEEQHRAEEFIRATMTLKAGSKATVRDVWTPVSAKLPVGFQGARLNLGALAKDSQEPVISAYIGNLHRSLKASSAAHRPPPKSGDYHHRTDAVIYYADSDKNEAGQETSRMPALAPSPPITGVTPPFSGSRKPSSPRATVLSHPVGAAAAVATAGAAVSAAGAAPGPRCVSRAEGEDFSSRGAEEQQQRRRKARFGRFSWKQQSPRSPTTPAAPTIMKPTPPWPAAVDRRVATASATAEPRALAGAAPIMEQRRVGTAPARRSRPDPRDRSRAGHQGDDCGGCCRMLREGRGGVGLETLALSTSTPRGMRPPASPRTWEREKREACFVCRGWGTSLKPTSRKEGLASGGPQHRSMCAMTAAAAVSPCAEEDAEGFGAAGGGFGRGCCSNSREMFPVGDMFWTRQHRRSAGSAPPA